MSLVGAVRNYVDAVGELGAANSRCAGAKGRSADEQKKASCSLREAKWNYDQALLAVIKALEGYVNSKFPNVSAGFREDAVIHALLALLKLKTFKSPEELTGWLKKVAKNKAIGGWRKSTYPVPKEALPEGPGTGASGALPPGRRRPVFVPIDGPAGDEEEPGLSLPDCSPSPEAQVLNKDFKNTFFKEAEAAGFERADAERFWARHVDGKSYAEIAAESGIKEATLRKRESRFRDRFREHREQKQSGINEATLRKRESRFRKKLGQHLERHVGGFHREAGS